MNINHEKHKLSQKFAENTTDVPYLIVTYTTLTTKPLVSYKFWNFHKIRSPITTESKKLS